MAHNYLLFFKSSFFRGSIEHLVCIIIVTVFASAKFTRKDTRRIPLPFFFELSYNEFSLLTFSQVFLIIFNPFLILFYGYQEKKNYLYSFSFSAVFYSFTLTVDDERRKSRKIFFKLKIFLERNEVVWH